MIPGKQTVTTDKTMEYIPEVDGQVASLRHIRIGLDLVPPERGHVQNVPLLQGTVQGVGLPKQREPLSIKTRLAS